MARSEQPRAGPSKPAKPYDRPLPASLKGKGKALLNRGAPAQPAQASRKGKKAWRKNIDVSAEEGAMEVAREEERVTGGRVADRKNEDLFVIDTVGNVEVAKQLRRAPKPLRSLAILSERSAIPSLSSRSAPTRSKSEKPLSAAEKARLRRIARRDVVEPDGTGFGSANIAATKAALHDAWLEGPSASASAIPVGAKPPQSMPGGFGEETVSKRPPKPPVTLRRQRETRLGHVEAGRGVDLPEGGVSYNPSQEAHEGLLKLAVEEEMERLANEEKEAERLKTLGEVVRQRSQVVSGGDYEEGMTVGPDEVDIEVEVENSNVDGELSRPTAQTRRKTRAERNKAARAKEALRVEALVRSQAKLAKSVMSANDLRRAQEKQLVQLAEKEAARKFAKREKARLGLVGGEKVGKHRVLKGGVEVQLGEDLAESLRQVKPEGNLFKDRYLALQKKALIEPRVPVLPKRKVTRTKEYEKHAWKRFV